jgi:hypothetical protein
MEKMKKKTFGNKLLVLGEGGGRFEVNIFKMSSKCSLARDERCLLLFMFMMENAYSHMCFKNAECFLCNFDKIFVLFTIQTFV